MIRAAKVSIQSENKIERKITDEAGCKTREREITYKENST